MKKDDRYLETERIPKLLKELAIPAVIAQLVTLVYNMVDRIYIGHIPESGGLALTGVGVCMPAILILSAFSQLVGMGGAPRASFFMGKGDKESAERTVGTCTLSLFIIGAALTAVSVIFAEDILMLFGASKNTIPYAVEYLKVYATGTIFVQCSMGLVCFITAQGFTAVSMISVLIGAAVNIVLDPIFIFVFDMGVKGAALATIVSQGISAVWVLYFLTSKKAAVRLKPKFMKIDFKYLLPALALGLSPFVMHATESLISICFNRSLLEYGGDGAVGAMTIFTTIMQICMLPLTGICQGAQPITSFNYGAGRMDRVGENFKLLFKCCMIFSTCLWLVIMVFPRGVVSIFASDASLISYAEENVRIYGATLFIMGIQLACQNMFLALGNAKISLFLALLRKIILLIPLIFILPSIFPWKVQAVFLAEPIADFIAASSTLILFLKTYKNKIFIKS